MPLLITGLSLFITGVLSLSMFLSQCNFNGHGSSYSYSGTGFHIEDWCHEIFSRELFPVVVITMIIAVIGVCLICWGLWIEYKKGNLSVFKGETKE